MRHRTLGKTWLALSGAVLLTAFAPAALAQEGEPKPESGEEGSKGEGEKAEGEKSAAKKEETKPVEAAPETGGDSPIEEPGKTYRFVGARYRGIIIPKFMMNLFGDGGRTVYIHAFGPEFGIRKDNFEYIFSLWWAGYKMKDTPFKASSDGAEAWEVVNANLNVFYLTSDFLWSSQISPEFAFNYGMGAGFGLVFGSLERTQAYPPSGSLSQDPYEWEKCRGQGNPPTGGTCGADNDHYNGYKEPSWANGGSKPIIFPWLVFQTGFRFKPSKSFVARLDLGFGTSGFFFGLGADYGLP